MDLTEVMAVVDRACREQGDERTVLLVLRDAAFHVREVVGTTRRDADLLGFVVFRDDPDGAARTGETCLLFVRPDRVERVLVSAPGGRGVALGFG